MDNIKPQNYGDNVTGYNFGGINEWKIFHNDGTYAAEPYWKDVAGIRPVVCLKSDVKAEKYSGMWKIK